MKKIVVVFCLCVCCAAVLSAQAVKGGTMYVAAKTIELKSSTGFFASGKGSLAYGAAVTVLQVNGKWAEVKSVTGSSVTGWTAVANLSAKRIVSSGGTGGATASEVALAGKGFNQEIENAYKSGGRLNYADVDRTEAQKVSKQEMHSFIVEGHLSLGD
jgi:hypothetical protein